MPLKELLIFSVLTLYMFNAHTLLGKNNRFENTITERVHEPFNNNLLLFILAALLLAIAYPIIH